MPDRPLRIFLTLALLLSVAFLAPTGPASTWAEEDDPLDEPLDDTAGVKVPFAEQVNQAIDRGVKWLIAKPDLFLARKNQMAHWGLVKGTRIYGGGDGPQYRHPAGPTALALYTLLKCGADPRHPIIERGFNWLREEHTITEKYDATNGQAVGWSWSHREGRGSYELSAQILALTAKYDAYKRTKNTKTRRKRGKLRIRDPKDKEWLQDLVAALVERRGVPKKDSEPEEMRGWRYNLKEITLTRGAQRSTQTQRFTSKPPPHANQDLSSTQLAALALFSAHQFGVKVDVDVWLDICEFTLSHQEEDGPKHERHDPGYKSGGYAAPTDRARGFMYIKGSPDGTEGKATGSMTACAIANLLMCKDVLTESAKGKKRWKKYKLDSRVTESVYDGIAWLDRNWSPFRNPHSRYGYHIYYLYAIERAMDLYGRQLIGKHVWYNEGAKEILARQNPVKVRDPIDKRAPETDGTYWMTGDTHEPKDVLDTCFALLFLKRATKDMVPGGVPVTPADGAPVDNR